MAKILHITSLDAWERASQSGQYVANTLKSQGFIHCSDRHQVVRVANFLFRGKQDLVLLCVNPEKLSAEVRYENCEGGQEKFPHVYGPIQTDAVESVVKFSPESDGTFTLPDAICEGHT